MRTIQKVILIPSVLFIILFIFFAFFYISEVVEAKNDTFIKENLQIFHKNNVNYLNNITDQTKNKEIFNNNTLNLYAYVIDNNGILIDGKKNSGKEVNELIKNSCKTKASNIIEYKNGSYNVFALTHNLSGDFCFVSESTDVNSSILSKNVIDRSYPIMGFGLFLTLLVLGLILRSISKKLKLVTKNLEHIIIGDIENWTENKSKIFEIVELDKYSKFILQKLKNTNINIQEKNKVNTINLIQEKNQKEKLNTEVNRFKKAFDSAYNMMYIVSPRGLIIYANNAILENLKMNFSELEGKKPTEIWHTQKEDEIWQLNINEIIQNKKPIKFECKATRKDRVTNEMKEYEAEVAMSPIVNTLNQVENILIIEKDVSDERQKDRIKTEFISVVSHELRTPMTIIRGYSSILADGKIGDLTEKQKEYINKINDETGRLLNLANDMLDLQKFEVGKVKLQLEPTNMFEMLQEIRGEYEVIYQKKNLYITFENYASKYNASIDKRYLHRAIANLLNNALKFTEKGGVQLLLLNPDEKTLVIGVKDTGVGIPKDAIEHLFTKFYQASNVLNRKQEGSGLGLSIVKNIVEAHEGIVWVESKEMIGTTFYIALNI